MSMVCFWLNEAGHSPRRGDMKVPCSILIVAAFLMISAPISAGESVGFIISPGQQEAVEQLLIQLRQWLPTGLHVTLAADSASSCQQQAETLLSAGITRIVDGCCQKLEVLNNTTHVIRAEYLCMARATSSVQDSVYAAVLHYLRAQIVNRVVVIDKMPPALIDVVAYKQFEHFRFVEEDNAAGVAELIKAHDHKLAVFASEFRAIVNAIQRTNKPENTIWFVPDVDMTYASRVLQEIGSHNLTLITTKVRCENDEEKLSTYQNDYVAEKMVEHLYRLMNGSPGDEKECTVTVFRWLPRQNKMTEENKESVRVMRSSDWIIEGSLTGGLESSLQLQPFYAITNETMERILNQCKQWFLGIKISNEGDNMSAEYSRDTMPEVISVHGPGVWRFHYGCVGTEGISYVCTLNGQQECYVAEDKGDSLLNVSRNTSFNNEYTQDIPFSDLNYRVKRNLDHNSNYRESVGEQTLHYMDTPSIENYVPRANHHYHSHSASYESRVAPSYNLRRQFRPRPGINKELLSAITPATFGCGGVITGCALCFVILNSLASLISPLGCIGPCTIASTSSCANLAGVIYKETALEAKQRRSLARRTLKMSRGNRRRL